MIQGFMILKGVLESIFREKIHILYTEIRESGIKPDSFLWRILVLCGDF